MFNRFLILMIICMVSNLLGDVATIRDINLVGENRGLMLVVNADSPLKAQVNQPSHNEFTSLTITIDNAKSGLDYSDFEGLESSPLSQLVVKENQKNRQVSLEMTFRKRVRGPVSLRALDNRIMVLLTQEPQSGFTWEATDQTRRKKSGETVQQKTVAEVAKPVQKISPEKSEKVDLQFEIAPEVAPSAQPVDKEVQDTKTAMVKYNVYGRDPFVPIVFDTSQTSELPRAQSLRLVGVLEDEHERIALLENYRDHNRAYALRENDPVDNGRILRIYRDKVVFLIRDFEVSRSFTLNLTTDAKQR